MIAPMEDKSSLVFKNVNKSWGNKKILQNINLELETGKFYCLLGPVGSGKTTLLRVIAGLEEIDPGGQIEFKNQDYTQMSLWDRNAAMVYQNFVLYPHFNVFDNIASPLKARNLSKTEISKKVQSITEMLRIEKLLKKRPKELSGGEMQRVAIARALAKEADIYLFDEILVNLDYKIREEMRPELRKITQGQNRMVIFSTSDPIDVLSMGDKVIIMDQGEILQFGNVNEVYENPKNIRVGKYFGYPEMNILETTIKDSGDKIQIEIGDQKQHLKKAVTRDYQGKYTIGIRPEDAKMISLNQQNEVLKDTFLFLKAIGIVSEVIGSDTVISSAIDKQFLTLFHPGIHIVEPDEEINVMIRKDDVLVFSAETGEIIGRGI